MTSGRRWLCVVLGVCLVIGTPFGVRALPPDDTGVSSLELLEQIELSATKAYSGYAESLGTLQLPVADDLDQLGPLFGERTRMRVWWRSSDQWRVDNLLATGETDLIHDATGTTRWEYEDNRATRTQDSGIRLPSTSDLLPPELARRLLEGAEASQLDRLPAAHIAGRDAPGLQLTPSTQQSSIDHVDIWADPTSGIPVRLVLYAKGSIRPSFTTTFMQLSLITPDASDISFELPNGAEFSHADVVDIADAANQFAPFVPPASLAGLPKNQNAELHAVGAYGSGLTQLIAIPLWDRTAGPLRDQLEITPTVRQLNEGVSLSVGPLAMLLTKFSTDEGGWLLAGTVTEETLVDAAHDIESARIVSR